MPKAIKDTDIKLLYDDLRGRLEAVIPPPPTNNGTYVLQVSINNGIPTYSWVSLSSLSGVTF